MSTILTFPNEILAEIFHFHCQSEYFAVRVTRRTTIAQAWAISQTCSRWRKVACSESALWSSFGLDFESPISRSLSNLLITYLSRSGSQKLRFRMEYLNSAWDGDSDDPRIRVLDQLLDRADRWLDVFIDISPRIFGHACARLLAKEKPVDGYFPNLEILNCEDQDSIHPHYMDEETGESLFRIFDVCPRLHTYSVEDSWSRDPVDFHNLTRLELGVYWGGGSVATLLSRCPRLEDLTLAAFSMLDVEEGSLQDLDIWSPKNPFVHHCLTRLCLPMYNDGFDVRAWPSVRLPSLTTVEVDEVEESARHGVEILGRMISQSGCTLLRLSIGKMPVTAFAELVSNAPSLQSLFIKKRYTCQPMLLAHSADSNLFAPLTCTELNRPLAQLTSLTIEFPMSTFSASQSPTRVSVVQQFCTMVRSRCQSLGSSTGVPGVLNIDIRIGTLSIASLTKPLACDISSLYLDDVVKAGQVQLRYEFFSETPISYGMICMEES